jgi:2-polyprenyl-6-methoxyphenol hydroxylase-like FAD-dependent oxidoreductase
MINQKFYPGDYRLGKINLAYYFTSYAVKIKVAIDNSLFFISVKSMDKNSKILIVGAGPVGLTLHRFLKKEGYTRVRHIDKSMTMAQESRAVGIHAFTLQVIFKELGLQEEFKKRGVAIQKLVFEKQGKILHSVVLPRFLCAIGQNITEEILGRDLNIQRGIECVYVDADGNARLKRQDGLIEEDKYDLIVGADGTHSIVRQMLGIEFSGKSYPQTWSLKDVEFDHPITEVESGLIQLHEDGVLLFVMAIGPKTFRVFSNSPDCEKYLPKDIRITSTYWSAQYHVHCRIANSYYKGKCVIMGDAAHTSSPVGGTGMNSGMEDAYLFVKALEQNGIKDWAKQRRRYEKNLLFWTDTIYSFMTKKGPFAHLFREFVLKYFVKIEWIQKRLFKKFSRPF